MDGKLRRSQLFTGAGPGALVDLVDDAVMIGGLDDWRYLNAADGYLTEPRLAEKVLSLLKRTPWWRFDSVLLREPPVGDERTPDPRVGVPGRRFPRWFLCMNGQCRSLVPWEQLEKGRHICKQVKRGKPPSYNVVPIRFAAGCTQGHLQDIDWMWFIHEERRGTDLGQGRRDWCDRNGSGLANDPLGDDWTSPLRLDQVGTSGELSDLVLRCRRCGASRGLQALREPLGRCGGEQFWLRAKEPCDQNLRLVTRTASNVYFPNTISALSMPEGVSALAGLISDEWGFFKNLNEATIQVLRGMDKFTNALAPYTDAQVWAEIQRQQNPVAAGLREAEWAALMDAPLEQQGEVAPPGALWFARRVECTNLPQLDRVVLVPNLTEVRAQISFTRLEPISSDAEGDFELGVAAAPLAREQNWVPAIKIQGEGLFLALNPAEVDRWVGRKEVGERAEQFMRAVRRDNERWKRDNTFPGIRLVMLHSLAHLLIQAISLDCGYSATAIRERLYCATETRDGKEITSRAGILLYTGSPGSDGTLGGLVEQGRRLGYHLQKALGRARLCSNDPVCSRHKPDDAQEGRHREGAACHGCLLIGEPSCERMNQDLDRALVVPAMDNSPELAFFRDAT